VNLPANERVIILGAGHAGGRMAQHLRKAGFTGPLTLVGDEAELPYERPALSKELLHGGKTPADIRLQTAEAWQEAGVDLALSSVAAGVDIKARAVRLADGTALAFDSLIVATGGAARRLDIPGAGDPRVLTLRTMADGIALARHLPAIKRLVVIGGGVIGLEVAAAARKHGVAVTVLEFGPRLMARIGPPVLSDWLLAQHRAAGVDVRLRATATAIEGGPSLTVRGHDAQGPFAFAADVVVSATGIAPAVDCLAGNGLDLRNGLAVDDRCQVPGLPVYAVGDVANTYNGLIGAHARLETWRNAENQPKALSELLHGRDAPYVEIPWMWTDQYERNIQVVGLWRDDAETLLRGEAGAKGSACLFLDDGVVTGGVLWDLGRDRRFLEKLVADRKRHDARQLADPTVALRTFN
jgi:3-phenylpropionate/trans-cinnamate dioxygenase ferredoxin reductase subunit